MRVPFQVDFKYVVAIAMLAVGICSDAAPSSLGHGKHAIELCFSTQPNPAWSNDAPNPLVPGDSRNWRLVADHAINPEDHPDNPYVRNGCWGKKDCREYWFQKNTGDIRYCVTDMCKLASVGFKLSEKGWEAVEGDSYVCTS